ncbi:MAG: hypothetical protein HZB25_07100 [Candidatus Eisenbacteria bacterium]|nr:hypothetical protein [Candidatus Eisenbacteria bacterium]
MPPALLGLLALLVAAGCAPGPSRRAARPETYGWKLMERRCQGCHDLPDPGDMTREDWMKGLDRMRKRFRLQPAEWDTLAALAAPDTSSTR